ncbi:MAG TPA: DNA polymerase ligase N-terminal domain-containing protein, partial [Opitutus sp.]|nr:DNA polymerase ligase N-terminal domain-containing protein [Opitutus sp.]
GQYGGGTVMVWDIGTYDVIGGSYAKGDLKLWLSGKKLAGEWHIFRIKSEEDKPVWLINKAGEAAKKITAKQENTSVLSGRTLEKIAKAKDAVWDSQRETRKTEKTKRPKTKDPAADTPVFVEPMNAREVRQLPDDENWIYEIKWDGSRALGIKHGAAVQLRSHNNEDLADDFPGVVTALRTLKAESTVIDGEVVALDQHGRPSFQFLKTQRAKAAAIVFYAFDLLWLNGEDWRSRPLDERKAKLGEIVADSEVKLSLSFEGPADAIVAQVKRLGLAGVIAKRRDGGYESGQPSGAWVQLAVGPRTRKRS